MAAIWRMKRSACRRGALSAPPKMVSTCRRNLRCSLAKGASSTTEARSRRRVKVSMALSVIWPAHIQHNNDDDNDDDNDNDNENNNNNNNIDNNSNDIMKTFLSQEASGMRDASQLPPRQACFEHHGCSGLASTYAHQTNYAHCVSSLGMRLANFPNSPTEGKRLSRVDSQKATAALKPSSVRPNNRCSAGRSGSNRKD